MSELDEIKAQLDELLENKRKREEKRRLNNLWSQARMFSSDTLEQDFSFHIFYWGNEEERQAYSRLREQSPKFDDFYEALEKDDGSIDILLQKKLDIQSAILDLDNKSNNRVIEERKRKSDEEYAKKNSNNWFRRIFG